MFFAPLFAAALSEATLLTIGQMGQAPKIDNEITVAEECAANVQYGAISDESGLMTRRYAVFHFGFCEKGVYFATRTSVPDLPQTLADGDTVELVLLPPGRKEPLRRTFRLAEKARVLKGITDFGVACCEFETLLPYGEVPRPKPGERWGVNMLVRFSSERETGYLHVPKAADELATLVYDPSLPSVSVVNFGEYEEWRASANLGAIFRFTGPKESVTLDSNSFLIHGLSFSKLDSEPEKNLSLTRDVIAPLQRVTLEAGKGQDVFYRAWTLWAGTVNVMNLDLSAGGKPVFRRVIRWDLSKGKGWKDAEGLPSFQMAFYPSLTNRLRLAISPNGVHDIVRAGVRVTGSKGNVVWEQALACEPNLKGTLLDHVLGELPCDDYTVRFVGKTAVNRTFRHQRTFAVRHFAWQDAHLGEDRVIVPPFKAIEVEEVKSKSEKGKSEDVKISFLQTGYRCGGVLWDEIYAKGENILAAPVSLMLNGREFKVQSSKFIEKSPDRVIREVTAISTSSLFPLTSYLFLTVRQEYDYDGYCWTSFRFDAKEPVEVRELKLVVPFKSKYLKYFQPAFHTDDREGPAPDLSLPAGNGEVWKSTVGWDYKKTWYGREFPAPMQSLVWFGGCQKGLTWFIESFRGTSLEDRDPQRLVRKGDVAAFEVELVNRPVVWTGETVIGMGWQPTPVKPRDPHAYRMASIMYGYACPSNAVFARINHDRDFYYHPNTFPLQTYPGDDASIARWTFAQPKRDTKLYREKLMEYCLRHKDWFTSHRRSLMAYYGGNENNDRHMGTQQSSCYFNPKQISCFWPEWEMYKSEWSPETWCSDDFFHEYSGTDPKPRVDKLMWDCRTALRHGFGGVFFDCFSPVPTRSLAEGDAYLRPDGSIQTSLGEIRGWRSIMRRSAVLCHKEDKNLFDRPYVTNHDTHGAYSPVMSFCSSAISTERGTEGGEFPIRVP